MTERGLGALSPALMRGDLAAARVELEELLASAAVPAVHLLLAGVCIPLEDLDAAQRHAEQAYRGHREAGDLSQAAAAAMLIAEVHEFRGDEPAVNGWLARARRLLEETGDCVERGYLELARFGCVVSDVAELEASAAFAFDTARRFGDTDLEVRALADGGLALVSQGRVAEGLARLDEAMAAVVAGDVRSQAAGLSCCAMLHACDRVGDLERAGQWADAVFRSARQRFGDPPPVVLQSHCRLIYGTILAELGRWGEAEAQFRQTRDGTQCLHYRADASARLAELRIRQGRVADAVEMLAGFEDCREAAVALARLSMTRGETDVAAAVLRRTLRLETTNRLTRGRLLSLLVEVELGRGELSAARDAAEELGEVSSAAREAPLLAASAALAAGRVAAATGEDAVPHLRSALHGLDGDKRPLLRADVQLELAAALRHADRGAAVAEARAALATFERLDARRSAGQAAALLRELGVPARMRSDGASDTVLSRREREVLDLLGEGLSNADIARRLFVTPKTAEHHVGSILGKLGVRTRAEAVALAATSAGGIGGAG